MLSLNASRGLSAIAEFLVNCNGRVTDFSTMMMMVVCTETPLSLSASLSRPRSVMLILVSGGAILDYRNGRSLTAVHVAVLLGNRDALMVRIITH